MVGKRDINPMLGKLPDGRKSKEEKEKRKKEKHQQEPRK